MLYERKTVHNKAYIIQKLVNLKYRDTLSVFEHLGNFKGLVNQITNMKMVLNNELQVLLLLISLSNN